VSDGRDAPAARRIEVAAGLVFRGGKLLITRRRPGDHLAGLWEFPGGKRHAGETFPECLRRELREELGIEVQVGRLIDAIIHRYPEKTVRLRFYHCHWLRHEPRPLGCSAFAWVSRGDLAGYEWPPADARLLAKLRRRTGLWRRPNSGKPGWPKTGRSAGRPHGDRLD
jgi:mutator protein MutT